MNRSLCPASVKRLRATATDSGEEMFPGDSHYQKIEAQQQGMQEMPQKVAGAMTGMLRIVAMGMEGNPGAVPDDIVSKLMGLDDAEDA